jgi:ribosome recycling factor
MLDQLIKEHQPNFDKTIEHLHSDLVGIRTGRANPALLNSVVVEAYGSTQPINQVASVSVSDSKTLTVSPWDKTVLPAIDKAIQAANLGLNPSSDGSVLRITLPPLSEDRRKELVKVVGQMAEKARIGIRNTREDILKAGKRAETDGGISKDDTARLQKKVQEIVDNYNAQIKTIVEEKEKEILTV